MINRHFFFRLFKLRSNFLGLRGVPLRNDDLNEIQVVSAHFMKNTIAYSPLEFQFIGPYAWVVFYIPKLTVMTKSAENIEKKIEAQLEKLKQLKAQKQAIEARERTKKKEQERKDDTRRKILLGSYLIKKMQANEANKEKILAELNEYLTENRDRQLFDLPDIEA